MSKLARAAMIVTVTQTTISWRRLGSVIETNSRIEPAPSMRAASYRPGSILVMPASSRSMHSPNRTQAPMTPTAGRAVSKSPSQARAMPSRPINRKTWLTRPFVDICQLHMMPAVGVIGAWVLFGLCMLLLLAGMTKIDPGLYEAARIDGAGPLREFVSITLPSLRQEVVVCVTVTVIAALASFDIVYISTQGGPGNSTLVPGLEIYYLAFFQREVGQASALAVALMALVLAVALPFEGIIIPLYYQMRDFGLLNTRWAIILPLLGLYMPFAVFWMRAHFINIPDDISEAARIDGANLWQLFWRIHVPLSMPALSSLAILLFLWTWNQFLLAVVLVDDPTQRTMAGALGAFQGQWGTDIPLLCAGSLLILTPTLLVFLIFQRRFVSALLQGSLKG